MLKREPHPDHRDPKVRSGINTPNYTQLVSTFFSFFFPVYYTKLFNRLLNSEKAASITRFSPLFYNRKEQQLPFTDSDGLYDFPSSDGKGRSTRPQHNKKSSVKRRDRKSSRGGGKRNRIINIGVSCNCVFRPY